MNKKPIYKLSFTLYNNKKTISNKKAFTLIEILIVITIISFLIIGLGKIDLSKGQDAQKSLAFSQKIQNLMETTRNNSLIGKGIGTGLLVPNSWKIEISKSGGDGGTGSIISYYSTGGNRNSYEKLEAKKYFEISKIECVSLDGSFTQEITGTGYIYMTGSNLNISSSDCANNEKILKIYTKYKNGFENIIKFNGVSGVIEKN